MVYGIHEGRKYRFAENPSRLLIFKWLESTPAVPVVRMRKVIASLKEKMSLLVHRRRTIVSILQMGLITNVVWKPGIGDKRRSQFRYT